MKGLRVEDPTWRWNASADSKIIYRRSLASRREGSHMRGVFFVRANLAVISQLTVESNGRFALILLWRGVESVAHDLGAFTASQGT